MKRISILATAVLLIAAGMAEARIYNHRYGYYSNRYRARWSIYKHGLISGDVYYSPHAFGNGHSGLVPGDVRYSPYAFGHGHSGLVYDDGGYCYPDFGARYYDPPQHRVVPGGSAHPSCSSNGHTSQVRTPVRHRETVEARRARRIELAQARRERNADKANDGKEIIAAYLKARNIDFRTTRTLGIEGKTISVDFVLNDGKTILKYWNPVEILSLGPPQGRKRKFYEKYLELWTGFCAEHLRAGGKIHQIISSDPDDILAKLPLCPDLYGTERAYALAQDQAVTAIETEPHP